MLVTKVTHWGGGTQRAVIQGFRVSKMFHSLHKILVFERNNAKVFTFYLILLFFCLLFFRFGFKPIVCFCVKISLCICFVGIVLKDMSTFPTCLTDIHIVVFATPFFWHLHKCYLSGLIGILNICPNQLLTIKYYAYCQTCGLITRNSISNRTFWCFSCITAMV